MRWCEFIKSFLLLFVSCRLTVEQDLVLKCPNGWSNILAKCYLPVSNLKTTWSHANKYCQRYGGKLAEPSGSDLTTRVGNLLNSTISHWIGFNQIGIPESSPEQGFWSDRSPATVDVGWWDNFQPDRRGGECTVLKYITEWKWFMTPCQALRPFMCEATGCPSDTFRCSNGDCISKSFVCNGKLECEDGFDEIHCTETCNKRLTGSQGEIIHPDNQSMSYLPRTSCQWAIEGDLGKYLQIQIIQLDLEEDVDFLEIWIGGQTIASSKLHSRYTGQNVNNIQPILSSNNNAIIRLVTDSTNEYTGIILQWRSDFYCNAEPLFGYKAENQLSTISSISFNMAACKTECLSLGSCISFTFDLANTRCYLMAQLPTLAPAAGSTVYFKTCPKLTGYQTTSTLPLGDSVLQAVVSPKQLSSLLYPVYHLDNLVAAWTISSTASHVITIEIIDMDLTNDGKVIIYDGDSSASPTLLSLTRSSRNTVITSTTNIVHVLYYSGLSNSVARRGFLLTYREGCDFIINANQGDIMSPGYSRGLYPNILQCSWVITSLSGSSLTLSFDVVFNLEQDKDYVMVYTSNVQNNPAHIGKGFSGNTTPGTIVSDSGRLLVQMTTSALGQKKGFKATFSAGCNGIRDSTLQITPYHATYDHNEIISITCSVNHIFSNRVYLGLSSVTLVCMTGGSWNKEIPTCSRVLCGSVPLINDGYITQNTGVYSGATTTYTCSNGYNLTGSAMITCQNSGIWENGPSCYAKTCGQRSGINNGKVEIIHGDGSKHGSILKYSCISDYQIIGINILTCQNGQWSNNIPSCERVKCGYKDIQNGAILPSGQLYKGNRLNLVCNQGYQISGGSPVFICGETPPACINIDECSTGIANCIASTCQDTNGGFNCKCNNGYKKLQDNSNICYDIQECGSSNGGCDHICTERKGSYVCSCHRNYVLFTSNGQNGITIPNGETGYDSWNFYRYGHTCLAIKCPIPPTTIGNGQSLRSQTTYIVGDTISFVCNIGYVPQGQTTLTCEDTGNWNALPPLCLDATCPFPSVPNTPNAVSITPQSSIRYRDSFTVSCPTSDTQFRTEQRPCIYDETAHDYRIMSGNLECPVVDCGVPVRLSGTLKYNYACTTVGCSFTLNCRTPWFQQVGNTNSGSTVTCGRDGNWGFGDIRCPGPQCSDPGTPPGGQQISTSYEEFSLVTFRCDQDPNHIGFQPSSSDPLECYWNSNNNSLMWNDTVPTCIDRIPPTFLNCPNTDIHVNKMSTSTVAQPEPRDNSNMIKTLNVYPPTFSVDHIVKSNMLIRYQATDGAGNTGSCTFNIYIKDVVAPVIRCRNSFYVQLSNENDVYSYDINSLVISSSDDSGSVQVSGAVDTIRLDRYSIGKTYTNTITATDPSGNTDQCIVQVTTSVSKCQARMLQLKNGMVTCNVKSNGGYICTASCNSDHVLYENVDQASVEISCNPNGDWSRQLPVCVAMHSAVYELSIQLSYKTIDIVPSYCISAYQAELESKIPTLVLDLTRECGGLLPSITVQKRSAVTLDNYYSGVYATINLNLEPSSYSSATYTQCENRIKNAFVNQASTVSSVRSLSSNPNIGCPASYQATFQATIKDGFSCSRNEEVRQIKQVSTVCVKCPAGYSSTNGRLCVKCSQGDYRDEGSQYCQMCPSNSRNLTEGASSIHGCYKYCPLGMTSASGLSPCMACSIDSYGLNERTCQSCPSGTHTLGTGAVSFNECRGICQAGSYSASGLAPCLPCPRGFYQSNTRSTTCLECGLDQTTLSTGSTTQLQCETAASIECTPGRCQNGGTCYVEQHQYYCRCLAGFTGKTCDTRISACASRPCYNNGVCDDTADGGYICYCDQGRATGNRCEHNINDCQFHSCLNSGACHDITANYLCLCPLFSGYTGSSCQSLRQVCNEQPCQNQGQCVASGNIRRKCICQPGYTGINCEQTIDECSSSPCKNNGICSDQQAGYSCQCQNGYTGVNCEIIANPCSTFDCNSGSCIHNYLDGTTKCICDNGYEKVNGQCQAINYCSRNPCQNGATCRQSGSSFICDCKPGFQGSRCQKNIDNCASEPCKNGGRCVDQVNSYTCQCDPTKPDTGGPQCNDQVDNCSPYPCVLANSRSCSNQLGYYTCNCYTGYTGINCQDFVNHCASYPCKHGSTCTNRLGGYSCQCPSTYYGNQCELTTEYCASSPCYYNGVCVNTDTGYVCQCKSGYKGKNCEVTYDLCFLANPCVGVGSRCFYDGSKFSCQCSGGYSGDYCEIKNNVCSADRCFNGGTCLDVGGQPVCQCVLGYGSSSCETNINDCTTTSCNNGSICVDGLNSFTCHCQSSKTGKNCDKDVVNDFDLILSTSGQFLLSDYFILPQKLGSTNHLSFSVWLQYTESTNPGTIVTFYGTNFQNNIGESKELLRLNHDDLVVSIGNQQTFAFNKVKIDDGKWHHVIVTWDGSFTRLSLYIDFVPIVSENHGQNSPLPQNVWFVLGGTYDKSTNKIDQTNSMKGRISRLYVTSSVISAAERSLLGSDFSFVPAFAINQFTVDLLDGVNALVDFNSELNSNGCYINNTCTGFKTASNKPKVSVCSSDMMVVSDRAKQPSWPAAVFENTIITRTNYLSAAETMAWKTYPIAFAGLDTQGNAAVCSYKLYNRRAQCLVPKKPLLGTINCVTITSGVRCQVTCDQSGERLAEPAPVYYSCGTYNAYQENILAYRYPSCTACDSPQLNIVITMTFDLQVSCSSIGQSAIVSSVRFNIEMLNTKLQEQLCSGADCSSVSVNANCLMSDQQVQVVLQMYYLKSSLIVGNQSVSTVDVLSSAVIDDSAIVVTYGNLDRSSYDIRFDSVCNVGRQLVNDCCAKCGFGTYYDISLSSCRNCARGTYLDAMGITSPGGVSTPCKDCPGGMTTALIGAQTIDECKDSCVLGRFYNLTIGKCEDCPVGFYQNLAGTFYCQPCSITMTTAAIKSTSASDCVLISSITTSTTIQPSDNTGTPATGASTSGVWSTEIIILTVLAIIVIIILILVILCVCCRGCLQSIFPCCVTKVGPEEKTQWHYVNRFGETNLKFVSYKLADIRRKKFERENLVQSSSEEDLPKNISIQVPVFEEKLNGTVKKKALHITNGKPTAPQATSIPTFTVSSGQQPKALPPIPVRLRGTPTNSPITVRRPPSAFNKPRVRPNETDYEDFILGNQHQITDSKISIDSDGDDYR